MLLAAGWVKPEMATSTQWQGRQPEFVGKRWGCRFLSSVKEKQETDHTQIDR
jgi:hypothetical protein